MKLSDLAWLPLLFSPFTLPAQHPDPPTEAASRLVYEYMQLSRLGPGYARDLSEETLKQFAALFDRGASLVWDLRRSPSDTLPLPLSVNEYLDLARKTYHSRQPVLGYSRARVTPGASGRSATARFRKVNLVMDDRDNVMTRVRMHLQVDIALDREKPLIRSITERPHRSPVRTLSVGAGYELWSSVFDGTLRNPKVLLAPGVETGMISFSGGIRLQSSFLLDFGPENSLPSSWRISTGLLCRQADLSASMEKYLRTEPDTVGLGSVQLACTAFERAAEVYEKITLTRIEIPVWFMKPMNNWSYLRAGFTVGLAFSRSHVHYPFGRTGGGWVTELGTNEKYYLDQNQEMDQENAGYFRNRNLCYPGTTDFYHLLFSLRMAAGVEKRFRNLGVGVEPCLALGNNPLATGRSRRPFILSSEPGSHSIFEAIDFPAMEITAGIRVFFSYTFQ